MARELPTLADGFSGRAAGRYAMPRHWATLFLLAALIALQGLIWFKAVETRGGPDVYARGSDFTPTIAAVEIVRAGQGGRLYDIAAQHDALAAVLAPYRPLPADTLLPFLHPPFEALALAPLGGLSYGALYLIWSACALAAFVATLALLARALPLPPSTRWLVIVGCAAYNAIHYALWLGQSSPFVTLGLCGAFVALRRGRPGWAGVALTLMALKPQLLLILGPALLLLGHWRALLAAAATLAVAAVAAMPWLGPLWPLRYAEFLIAINRWDGNTLIYPEVMPSWRGLVYNLLRGAPAQLTGPLVGVLSLATLLALLWVGRRSGLVWSAPRWDARTDRFWAFAIFLAILAAPHIYLHDLLALLLPLWIVVASLQRGDWPAPFARLWPLLFGAFAALALPFHLASTGWRAGLMAATALLCFTAAALLGWRCVRSDTPRAAVDVSTVLPPRAGWHGPRVAEGRINSGEG